MTLLKNSGKSRRGMSLVEIAIVLVVMGVVFAAVFLFFTKGTEHFHFSRRQNELATAGRMTLDRISNRAIWAGYMPQGGWDNDEWHPIETAGTNQIEFYADWAPFKSLDNTDYVNISVVGERIRMADRAGNVEEIGHSITGLAFKYYAENGTEFSQPLNQAERDQVRHVEIQLTLASTYAGNVYQTVMVSTVSPRNLGINHNINPAFFAPPPMNGNVVFNISGPGPAPTPTTDEIAMVETMELWGLTINQVTDDSLDTYDYEGNNINLLVLRHMPGAEEHTNIAFFQALTIPIITLSGREACDIFGMGSSYVISSHDSLEAIDTNHPINKDDFNGCFRVYLGSEPQDMLYDISAGTELLTTVLDVPEDTLISGVTVKDEDLSTRRVHYSAWMATKYNSAGWEYFRRIVFWQLGGASVDPGEEITPLEDFEDNEPGEVPVDLWDDDLNDPQILPDTGLIYMEDFEDALGTEWDLASLGPNGSCQVIGGNLRMDRLFFAAGSPTRNLAAVILDLSAYDETTDSLLLMVDAEIGTSETIDIEDGVFFRTIGADTTYTRIDGPGGLPGWQTLFIDLDQAAVDYGYPFNPIYQILLSQFDVGPWNTYGIEWNDFRIALVRDALTVAGWTHGLVACGFVDDWAISDVQTVPGDYSWTLLANNPGTYSSNCYCYIQSPSTQIPVSCTDAVFSFRHKFDFEPGSDGGFIMISADGGPWNQITTDLGYTGIASGSNPIPGGTAIYTGGRPWTTETVDLSSYSGQTVRFRFVAGSDGSAESDGWTLDNFSIQGTVCGYIVEAIQFESTSSIPPLTHNCNVYLQSTSDASVSTGEEWSPADMTHVVVDGTVDVSDAGYCTITLDNPFVLPDGTNLKVKIVQDNSLSGGLMTWRSALHNAPFLCRVASSDDPAPIPTSLVQYSNRPVLRLLTSGGTAIVIQDGDLDSAPVPFNSGSDNNNFEAIYLSTEMETTGGALWVSAGTNNDWEIGTPLFIPDIDPALTPGNGNKVAGTDLTDDGYYNSDSWCWLRSSAYEMPEIPYDTTVVRFDRCIRMSGNDFGHVTVAFSATTEAPTDETDWSFVREYVENHSIWENEEIDLTSEFNDAVSAGMNYFFIRYVLDSGPYGERGGLNVDNIQFFGRSAE